jgi:hypoxanthine phosphoribosyltransferase
LVKDKELDVTPTKKRMLLDAETIATRIKELGSQISTNHPEGNLLLIGILKGSFMFVADLIRHLTVPCQVDFARIASYGHETVTSGKLDIIMDAKIPVQGRDVILVDDIVDTGLTLSEYRKRIHGQGPRTLELAAFVNKTGRRDKHVEIDYVGFHIPEGFLVGYGLDCDEEDRHHGCLYVLE